MDGLMGVVAWMIRTVAKWLLGGGVRCDMHDFLNSIRSPRPKFDVKSIYMMCWLCHLFELHFGFLMIDLLMQNLHLFIDSYHLGNLMIVMDYREYNLLGLALHFGPQAHEKPDRSEKPGLTWACSAYGPYGHVVQHVHDPHGPG